MCSPQWTAWSHWDASNGIFALWRLPDNVYVDICVEIFVPGIFALFDPNSLAPDNMRSGVQ